MEQKRIDRINELARKARSMSLTEAEQAERTLLREEYIESFRRSLVVQLDNTYFVDEDGNETKLPKKT